MLQVEVGRGQRLPPGPGEDLCLPPKSDRVLPRVLGKGPHQNGAFCLAWATAGKTCSQRGAGPASGSRRMLGLCRSREARAGLVDGRQRTIFFRN